MHIDLVSGLLERRISQYHAACGTYSSLMYVAVRTSIIYIYIYIILVRSLYRIVVQCAYISLIYVRCSTDWRGMW